MWGAATCVLLARVFGSARCCDGVKNQGTSSTYGLEGKSYAQSIKAGSGACREGRPYQMILALVRTTGSRARGHVYQDW
ncbi:hypothetical protein ACQKWADRAFT_282724 [Trichoderma austrokoningii]